MTQQNAALVEESAAAAESLKDQAHRMTTVVANYRLDGIVGRRRLRRRAAGPRAGRRQGDRQGRRVQAGRQAAAAAKPVAAAKPAAAKAAPAPVAAAPAPARRVRRERRLGIVLISRRDTTKGAPRRPFFRPNTRRQTAQKVTSFRPAVGR